MKTVAASLMTVLSDARMLAIRDRRSHDDSKKGNYSDLDEVADEIASLWQFDLYSRKPGPAYTEDGEFVGTDLDLVCFLSALVERGAVINLPFYKSRRVKQDHVEERVISAGNRHGKVLGLTSNKQAFSFSIKVDDMNVVSQDRDGNEKVGAPRNFMLVDVDGKWWDGWRKIEFSPTAKENDFLNDKQLWSGRTIVFKNFVHPNRWISFYGKPYFLTKALIARLEDRVKFLGQEVKRLTEKLTASGKLAAPTSAKPDHFNGADGLDDEEQEPEGDAIEVTAFEARVDFGGFVNGYKAYRPTLKNLQAAKDERKRLIYTTLPGLRFATRTVELAFAKHGFSDGGHCKYPSWVQGATFQPYRFADKPRTDFLRLVLAQPGVGEQGISLAFRVWTKTERVACSG